jgi:hypothetical protein
MVTSRAFGTRSMGRVGDADNLISISRANRHGVPLRAPNKTPRSVSSAAQRGGRIERFSLIEV